MHLLLRRENQTQVLINTDNVLFYGREENTGNTKIEFSTCTIWVLNTLEEILEWISSKSDFIELTGLTSGSKVMVSISDIRMMSEETDGTHIRFKKSDSLTSVVLVVKESYKEIQQAINYLKG